MRICVQEGAYQFLSFNFFPDLNFFCTWKPQKIFAWKPPKSLHLSVNALLQQVLLSKRKKERGFSLMLWQPLRIANHVGKEKLDRTATDKLQIKIKRMFKSFYWIGFCMFVVWKGHTTTALHIISLIFCLPYNICQLFKECFWTWTNREKERRCDPVSCIVLPNNNLDSLSLPLLSYLPYLQLSHTDGPKTVKCSMTLQP